MSYYTHSTFPRQQTTKRSLYNSDPSQQVSPPYGHCTGALLPTRYLTLNPGVQKCSEPAFKLLGTLNQLFPQRLV